MPLKERRPIYCYGCGRLLGFVEVEWTQDGMKQFRASSARLKAEHDCAATPAQDAQRGTQPGTTANLRPKGAAMSA